MSDPIRLVVHGASGRMGQALLRLCAARSDCVVVAAVARRVAQRAVDGVPQYSAAELGSVPAFDVAIDFSLPEGFDAILGLCRTRGTPLVSGTTGLAPAQHEAVAAATAQIALLWASNFSVGVALLTDLVRRAAAQLPQWDCDILEAHHLHKRDAPSGTALTLGQAAAEARGRVPNVLSIRAGDIIGEHTVQFTGAGERIELVHRATHRDVFAHGALLAALALHGRPAGRYGLAQLLFAHA